MIITLITCPESCRVLINIDISTTDLTARLAVSLTFTTTKLLDVFSFPKVAAVKSRKIKIKIINYVFLSYFYSVLTVLALLSQVRSFASA